MASSIVISSSRRARSRSSRAFWSVRSFSFQLDSSVSATRRLAGSTAHKAALGEIGVDLRPLDRAAPELIRLVVASLDLPPRFEGELDGGRRHLLDHQEPDGFIDRRACQGLAVWLGTGIGGAVAHIPGLELPSRLPVARSKILPASPADGAPLEERDAFARR